METPPEIPWPRVATFVRKHIHDVRNHLNGLDLEAALLTELLNNDEAKGSLARLRHQIRDIAAELRALSAKFSPARAAQSKVSAQDLFAIWKDQAAAIKPAPKVEWRAALGDAHVNIDLDALARTFRELLANAVAFGTGETLRAEASVQGNGVAFQLIEPKAEAVDCENWANAPLTSSTRGGYGLGLWVMQQDIAASGGEVQRRYDATAGTLATTLTFPFAEST